MGRNIYTRKHKQYTQKMRFFTFTAIFLLLSTSAVYSRRIAEAGFKEDVEKIKNQALELGSKGLQFLGKAFEKTSSQVETGLVHLENAGKTVVDVGKEIGEMGKGLFESGKEIFETKNIG